MIGFSVGAKVGRRVDHESLRAVIFLQFFVHQLDYFAYRADSIGYQSFDFLNHRLVVEILRYVHDLEFPNVARHVAGLNMSLVGNYGSHDCSDVYQHDYGSDPHSDRQVDHFVQVVHFLVSHYVESLYLRRVPEHDAHRLVVPIFH